MSKDHKYICDVIKVRTSIVNFYFLTILSLLFCVVAQSSDGRLLIRADKLGLSPAPSLRSPTVAAPAPDEYVAAGAARQAAWVLSGDAEAPRWRVEGSQRYAAPLTEGLAERYHRAAERYLER